MSRIRLMGALSVALLLGATAAFAQSGASSQTGAQGNAQINSNATANDANASLNANASADAGAKASAERMRKSIEDRAAKVSAKARTKADAELDVSAKTTDESAETKGDANVASLLAAEFGMTADAISAEKSELDASWGNLMIAHTLAANSNTAVTAAELVQLKKDGMGWGQIAAGLGFNLGSAVKATVAESKIAAGEAKANGHVAVINGAGAKAGLGTNANVNAATRGANAKAGAGVGVKIGH